MEHVAISIQPSGKVVKTLMKNRLKSEPVQQICYFSGNMKIVIGLKSKSKEPPLTLNQMEPEQILSMEIFEIVQESQEVI